MTTYNKTLISNLDENKIDTLQTIQSFIFDACFILFPLIGFIAQYIKIKKLKNANGFSKLISLILILAFIFRIFFWIGKQFAINLLLQAVAGLIMQMLLLFECVSYTKFIDKERSDYFRLKEFWNWPYYEDYLFFIINLITLLSFISYYIGYSNLIYIEALGSICAITEAMLGMPQVFMNYRNKNTDTLSYIMIGTWILGDSFKIIYFIATKAPIQLTLCGCFQLTVNFIIAGQIIYYSRFKNSSPTKEIRIN